MSAPRLMRVVVDSNVLFSALISPHGPPHRICRAWRAKRFALVTCEVQLDEIRRASRYPKLRDLLQPQRVGRLVNDLHGALVFDDLSGDFEVDGPHDACLMQLACARIMTAAAFCQDYIRDGH